MLAEKEVLSTTPNDVAKMNVKISGVVICVEAIMYLILYNLHECTFNGQEAYRNLLKNTKLQTEK